MSLEFLHGAEVVQIDNGLRPIRTVAASLIGIVGTAPDADDAAFPLNTPVLVTGPRHAAELGATGTLKDAFDAVYSNGAKVAMVVRVAEGADAAGTKANVAGTAAAQSGVFALLLGKSVTGQQPRILIAPGHTKPADVAQKDPVAAALEAVAPQLRAITWIEGPGTTEANAVTYAGAFGSDRVMIVDPAVTVFDAENAANETRPPEAYAAGVMARTDAERGFWWSPSNKQVLGIVATARPISFNLSERDTEANRLNAANVTTIVRQDGFRLWGNRSQTADPNWAFISVRRTADIIYDSVERAHLWAMDRPFSAQLIKDIQDGVQGYLDTLVSLGALLGGTCWLDPELNTEANLKAGRLYINFDIEPPAPLEHLIFQAHRNGSYYEELVADVALAAS